MITAAIASITSAITCAYGRPYNGNNQFKRKSAGISRTSFRKIAKTKELIPELVGWIKSCGYDCEVKPDSFVASSIADKISK